MNKLQHSLNGFLRSIQISEKEIFAFCEGKRNDLYFYTEILEAASSNAPVKYKLSRIENIEGNGGKIAILNTLNRLKSKGLLANEFKEKKFKFIFFLDKDADCITQSMEYSDHIIYTSLYDVESHFYFDSNLRRAIAIALSISINDVPEVFNNQRDWCMQKAKLWREWIMLCVYSQKYKINCGCGYSRMSAINGNDFIKPSDMEIFNKYLEALNSKEGTSVIDFQRQFIEVRQNILEMENSGKLFTLLKGKWLSTILHKQISKEVPPGSGDDNSFPSRLTSAAMACLDYKESWAEHYIKKVMNITKADVEGDSAESCSQSVVNHGD